MENRYKMIISNKNLYKEIELSKEKNSIKIGTAFGNDIRLHRDLFFEQIEMTLINNNNIWSLLCSDNIYISFGDSRKLLTTVLKHGDEFKIKYQQTNNEIFSVEFLIDFENNNRRYERKINTSNLSKFYIGADSNCEIQIKSQYLYDDLIEVNQSNGLILNILKTTYGVYRNGSKIKDDFKISDGDFFSVSDFIFYYRKGYLWTEIRDEINIKNMSFEDYPTSNNYPRFDRNTRVKLILNKDKIEILDPPQKPQKPKNNIIISLLPSIGMLLTSGMMAFMGGSMMIFSVISGVLAIVTTILTIIQGKIDFKKESKERIEKYNKYIENKEIEIQRNREQEKKDLEKIYLDLSIEKKLISAFSSDLFDRQPNDDDFLKVRLGIGNIKATREINYKKQERLEIEDELQLLPEKLSSEYSLIKNAPVICDFKEGNAIGIIGKQEYRYSIMKNIIIDICIRHFYSDVELFFIATKEHKEKINWLRFLPYVKNKYDFRNIVCDDDSKNRVFDYLYKELSQRENNEDGKHLLVFFYDEYGFQTHPISKFVNNLKDLSATFIFMEDEKGKIPLGCSTLVEMCSSTSGILIDTSDQNEKIEFTYNTVEDKEAYSIINYLSPIYTEEISLEGSLTKNISLFELFNIMMIDDLDLSQRWQSSQVFKSMAAPIGVTKSEIIYLDLHDKAHGPHGLVAGTTGSGKSEILQTYILSMATLFHPYEVSFLIIDFKGGGMVNQFKNLPHLLGAITNIDGKEINRSLKSIKAELQKRQRLFAEAGVNHIDKYIQKYREKKISEPIPHLIVIVDEFAELKSEQPDFMKELISASRIGRSLGVHLILATQKPSGQVDDQIWSNSRFKLCLKVQSPEDSNEVLKSPLASEIKEAGRAYFQVGTNEVFELFQSAYSGAPEQTDDMNIKEYCLYEINESGRKLPIYVQKKKKSAKTNRTQLEAIVDYVNAYCKNQKINKLPNICLPPLPRVIDYPNSNLKHNVDVPIGLYDDPDNQIQSTNYVDINNNNTLIIGSSQYGKTNLLQSMIKTIITTSSAKQSSIYIIDFGSMILKNFENSNHVGGVVCSSEDEKLKNLFKIINNEIMLRKEKLASIGLSSYSSYADAGYTEIPRIYLFIDNLTALFEMYLQDDDILLTIIREGISVGISTIVANAQTTGIGYKYLSNFSNRIAFYCNDSNEYINIFENMKLKPDSIPGRCIIRNDNRILECQTYLAFNGEKEIDRVKEMQDLISKVNIHNKGVYAKKIPYIPSVLTYEIMEQDYNISSSENYKIPIGLTYKDVEPFYINLSQLGIIGLCGKENTGHKNFVQNVFNYLTVNHEQYPVEAIIFDDINHKFESLKNNPIVKTYTLNIDSISEIIQRWYLILEERYNALLEKKTIKNNYLLLMLIQNNDIAKKINDDYDLLDKFNDMITRFKGLNVAFIFTNYVNASLSYDAPEPLRAIKKDQHVIFFENLDNLKPFEVPYEEIRTNRKRIEMGDAYYIQDNLVTKLKMIKSEQ